MVFYIYLFAQSGSAVWVKPGGEFLNCGLYHNQFTEGGKNLIFGLNQYFYLLHSHADLSTLTQNNTNKKQPT